MFFTCCQINHACDETVIFYCVDISFPFLQDNKCWFFPAWRIYERQLHDFGQSLTILTLVVVTVFSSLFPFERSLTACVASLDFQNTARDQPKNSLLIRYVRFWNGDFTFTVCI